MINLTEYGCFPTEEPPQNNCIPARVSAVYRGEYRLLCQYGEVNGRLKPGVYYQPDSAFHEGYGSELYPTVGDYVWLLYQEAGDSLIVRTMPRRSFFSRRAAHLDRGEQLVAANFDYVFLLMSLNQNFNLKRLERYLTAAWQSGGLPVVVLTKADLAEDAPARIREAERVAVGAEVAAVSALTGFGMERLAGYLEPKKTIVFLGSSGVGKSSLVNALAGETLMKVSEIREEDARGRHTTTHRQLLRLDSGVLVIDTPGMRELGMWDVRDGLGPSFADVENILGNCKFRDCRHQSEPGCAVTDAIRRGELSQERWESYLRLRAEARYADDKAAYQREKQQWRKDIVKMQRQTRLPDYQHDPCPESFTCKVCGTVVVPEEAGSQHRNHCPQCLSSLHVDNKPGDRASLCRGIMDPIGVWVRKNGEWAVIHRCRSCGVLHSNRIAADDNPALLMSIAMKPLAEPPFPLWSCGGLSAGTSPNPSTPSGTRR